MKKKLLIVLLLLSVSLSALCELPKGFVYVRDEIPGIQIELRYYSCQNFLGTRVNGYQSDACILTREACAALKKVHRELNTFHMGLKIFDCYRPQRAVDHFICWAKNLSDTKMKDVYYPGVAKKDLFKRGYIASRSSHSRGSTADLTIIDLQTGKELDMGSGFDFFGSISAAESRQVTTQQRANRLLLKTLMLRYGFSSYDPEWWHFTLKNEPFPDTYFNFPVRYSGVRSKH